MEKGYKQAKLLTKFLRKKYKYNNNFFLTDIYDQDLLKYSKRYNIKDIKKLWLDYIDNKDKKEFINLYLSVPFCKKKCTFCIHASDIINPQNERDQKESYVKSIIGIINYYNDIFKKTTFNSLFFGGGTPSILDEDQLERIMQILFQKAKFKKGCEKTIEVNPDSLTEKKVAIFHKYGFNRISMGVQSLDQNTLNIINRGYQTKEHVINAIKWLTKYNFRQVAVDMIYGLYKDSPTKFKEGIKILIEAGVSNINFYCLQPTRVYIKSFFDNKNDDFLKHLAKFIEVFHEMNKRLTSKNLPTIEVPTSIKSNSNCIRYTINKKLTKFPYEYNYNVEGIGSILGLGHHSNSIISQKIHYHSLPLKEKIIENSFIGIRFNDRMNKIYYLHNQLTNNNYLDILGYQDYFQTSFFNDFKKEYNFLTKKGLMYLQGNKLHFAENIKNNARNKFIIGLIFVNQKEIKNRIYKFIKEGK